MPPAQRIQLAHPPRDQHLPRALRRLSSLLAPLVPRHLELLQPSQRMSPARRIQLTRQPKNRIQLTRQQKNQHLLQAIRRLSSQLLPRVPHQLELLPLSQHMSPARRIQLEHPPRVQHLPRALRQLPRLLRTCLVPRQLKIPRQSQRMSPARRIQLARQPKTQHLPRAIRRLSSQLITRVPHQLEVPRAIPRRLPRAPRLRPFALLVLQLTTSAFTTKNRTALLLLKRIAGFVVRITATPDAFGLVLQIRVARFWSLALWAAISMIMFMR
jgi:hypothetical protein